MNTGDIVLYDLGHPMGGPTKQVPMIVQEAVGDVLTGVVFRYSMIETVTASPRDDVAVAQPGRWSPKV